MHKWGCRTWKLPAIPLRNDSLAPQSLGLNSGFLFHNDMTLKTYDWLRSQKGSVLSTSLTSLHFKCELYKRIPSGKLFTHFKLKLC